MKSKEELNDEELKQVVGGGTALFQDGDAPLPTRSPDDPFILDNVNDLQSLTNIVNSGSPTEPGGKVYARIVQIDGAKHEVSPWYPLSELASILPTIVGQYKIEYIVMSD